MGTEKVIQLIIDLGVAIGTIAVTILAIWGDRIKAKLGVGPRLVLSLIDPEGESIDISSPSSSTSLPSRYYHLRVSNVRRWSTATNVRVVITGIAKPAADGRFVRQELIGPLQLMWRFSMVHPALYSTLGPDDICDLGFLKQGGDKFKLTPYVYPNNFPGDLGPSQKMQIEVQAIADNAESKPICIEISWDGEWIDDTKTMANHLVVKEIDCQNEKLK